MISGDRISHIVYSALLAIILSNSCDAIKCFDCNSANNSACLDLNLRRMHAIVPVVDCGRSIPNVISKNFFCRKITQTILHVEKTPEVRVTRSCGWVKHKRECYTSDNKDHLETVCQCFGDMCNGSPITSELSAAILLSAILSASVSSIGYV